MAKFVISICGRQLELHNEPVHLVYADGDGHALLNCMFDQSLCVQHHLGRDTEMIEVLWKAEDIKLCTERVQDWENIKQEEKEEEKEEEENKGYSLLLLRL